MNKNWKTSLRLQSRKIIKIVLLLNIISFIMKENCINTGGIKAKAKSLSLVKMIAQRKWTVLS